jgi:peptide/nickel transport system substrate-binding protein
MMRREGWASRQAARLAVGSVLLALAVTACGSSVTTSSPGAAATAAGSPAGSAAVASPSAAAKAVLALGADISDINSLDPQKAFTLTSPIPMHAAYETLVTMDPGDYVNLKPLLATSWERADNGKAWVFHLKDGVKFSSNNPLTADDVVFTFERLKNLKVDASALADNIDSVSAVDPATVKVTMVDPNQPLLPWLISPNFGIIDSKVAKEHGAVSGAGADTQDKATEYLESASAGTGPYLLKSWTRNGEIDLERNPSYWRSPAPFGRVIIRHVPDSATQLLELQRGDIDVALNLTFDQIQSIKTDPHVKIVKNTSLDYLYLTLTADAALAPGLGNKAARQAVLYSIDYDGIINGLLGGDAVRPLSFIPVGLGGSTAELNQQVGYHQDLDKAKQLLTTAGLASGFSFKLSYGTGAAVAGIGYDTVAQKLKSDLARVGITADLNPLQQSALRDGYRAGQLASVLTFWNPDAPDPALWADPTVQRVAKRVRWTPPKDIVDLVAKADGEQDPKTRDDLYVQYQKQMADQSLLEVLLQPVYSIAVRSEIGSYTPTAAGWQVDLYTVAP